MNYRAVVIFICCAVASLLSTANPLDSVKVIKKNGLSYIMHKVEKGDGFLALARRYNTTVDDIKKANPKLKDLRAGQKVNIPLVQAIINDERTSIGDTLKITVDESHANADSKEINSAKIHTVIAGETLNKIAQKYKITTQHLLKWNAIKNGKIDIGQQLIVSGNTAIKPYEKWNAPNSLAAKADSPKSILAAPITLVEETTQALSTPLNTHPTIPVGSFVLCINPETKKQILIQIEHTEALPIGYTIGLKPELLSILGYTENKNRISIKYNQP